MSTDADGAISNEYEHWKRKTANDNYTQFKYTRFWCPELNRYVVHKSPRRNAYD